MFIKHNPKTFPYYIFINLPYRSYFAFDSQPVSLVGINKRKNFVLEELPNSLETEDMRKIR